MDDADADTASELEPREPTLSDLVALCRELNARDAKYVVVGGFAVRAAGFVRQTMDIDLVIDTARENEARVYQALETLPDQAVLELKPGEVEEYGVCRVGDEFTVDLMRAACGIGYAEASQHVVVRVVDSVPIPFASPLLLWRTKRPLNRGKDYQDLRFLHQLLKEQGITPPE